MQSQDDVTVTACAADVERAGAATAANAPEMEQEAQVPAEEHHHGQEHGGRYQNHPELARPRFVLMEAEPVDSVIADKQEEEHREPAPGHQQGGRIEELAVNQL